MTTKGGNGGNLLLGPDGKMIPGKPGLLVVKAPVGSNPNPQVLEMVGKATNCAVLVLPSEMDVYSGRVAKEFLESMHTLIHTALRIDKENQ